MSMIVFLELNDVVLNVEEDDAVDTMLSVAAGQIDESALTNWLSQRIGNIENVE